MSFEEWRTIPGMEGIAEASSLGRIRSVERSVWRSDGTSRRVPSKVLALHSVRGGSAKNSYLTVNIVGANGMSRSHVASSLVLAAFACPRPDGLVAGYRNGIRTDLRPCNLFWRTKESISKKNSEDPSEQEILGMAEQIRMSWSEEECRRREVNPRPRWQLPVVSSEWIPRKVMDQIESINSGDQYSSKSEALG